jgi:tape measure domain-containing protein
MATLGDLVVRIGADTRDLNKSLGLVQRNMRSMTSNFTALGEQMTRSFTLPIVGLGAAAVKSAADLETLETSFISLTGGAEQAANMVAQLNEFTAKTPFQLEEVGKAARQLIASGTAVGEVSDQLQFLGDIAATSGSSIEEIAAIFAKVNAKGKVELENINQLAERGIDIFKALADATGLPADKLGAGRVSVEQFNEVLKSFAEEGGFAAGAMERLSETAAGKFSTALDNAKLALANMGQNLLPLVNEALERMTVLFQGIAKLTPDTLKLAGGVGALAAALGPLLVSLPKIIAGVNALKNSFKLTAPAVLAVSAVLGTVIGLFIRVKKEANQSAESVKEVQRALDELTESELRREAGVTKFAKRESINKAVAQSLERVAEANRELESIEEKIKQGGQGLRAIYRNRIIDLQNYRDEFQRSADAGQLLLDFLDEQKKKLDELGASTMTVANLFAILENRTIQARSSMGAFFSDLENTAVDAFETVTSKVELLLARLESLDSQNNKVTQTFMRFGEVVGFAFADAAANAESSSQTFTRLFKRIATGAIQAARAQVTANAAVIASERGPLAPVFFVSTLAIMEGLINQIPIPQFAQGGMVFGPTTAIVGDNMNARIDPEVIAPLSKLKDMLGGNQVQVVGRISGQDIWLANDRATRERNRIG